MHTTYHLDCGSGYGGEPYSVGQVLRNSDHRIVYEATPARIAAYEAQLPAWATLDVVRSCTSRSPGAPAGAEGCFILPQQFGGRPVAATARDAIRGCERLLADVKYKPNATLLHVHESNDHPWTLWQVQEAAGARLGAMTGRSLSSLAEPLMVVSLAAADLIGVALRQQYWRDDSRWQQLLDVATVEERDVDRCERTGSSSGDELRLTEIRALAGDRREVTLYRVREDGWAMVEDGDEWQEVRLFPERGEALADFAQRKASVQDHTRGGISMGDLAAPAPEIER